MRAKGPIAESEALVVDTWIEGADAPLTYRLISTCAGGYLEVLPGSGERWMPVTAVEHAFHALARRHAVLCVFPETVRRTEVTA